MSSLPLTFSLSEIPANLGYNFHVLSASATASFDPPADGRLWVVEGIDSYAVTIVGAIASWYNINSTGQMPFAHNVNLDPLDTHIVVGTWRGHIAVPGGGHFQAGVDSTPLPTEMGLVVWGSVVPINGVGLF
jgi:hypothetical protein